MNLPRLHIPAVVTLAQIGCVAAMCYGTWLIYEPAAYIVAGLTGTVILQLLELAWERRQDSE